MKEIRAGQELLKEEILAKMETYEQKMDANIDANQEKMVARIDANNEKFEVLRGTLASWMHIDQARTVSSQEEIKAKMKNVKRRWRPQYTSSGPS
jgi:hypothetical protein